ncbi:MAG: long-chain fatty acid--CoA ligase, partial [Deltaproteobacteria bacterium]|nr:long-chain fatty acid--CoA ligase [Deltaproteobacteria bacterium]
GQPLPGVTVQVCDKQGNEAAAGEIGEIVCSGQNIMAGYYKDPEATARVLQDGRLSTGDMGRIDDEGYLYITGRKKEIIISGGINIFPGEIEEVLREHPQVHDTAVFGVPDRAWGEKVIAAVVLATPGSVSEQGLVTLCRSKLAGFKCPKEFIFLDALPRNAAQKVVREELRKEYKQ